MSSLWGYTDIVVEGENAKVIYDLLCKAKAECALEQMDYHSDVIKTEKGEYCFHSSTNCSERMKAVSIT